mgnify:CR=1 FL=1
MRGAEAAVIPAAYFAMLDCLKINTILVQLRSQNLLCEQIAIGGLDLHSSLLVDRNFNRTQFLCKT